ncbi:hypothetical protein JMJ56_25370 [Belnapia sp. T18]|uniref:Uncharacterized protein n=1 Tax=Belnapia arida TaxID=2804533 RepID=A0ABS1U9X1_9PROT|nr:hypothetical protein [Belnapia arida]MBL6081330.1 hypothetical protein [Belnapia arida]
MTTCNETIITEALAYAAAAIAILAPKDGRLSRQGTAMTELLRQRAGNKFSDFAISVATSQLTGEPMPGFFTTMETKRRKRRATSAPLSRPAKADPADNGG